MAHWSDEVTVGFTAERGYPQQKGGNIHVLIEREHSHE